MARDRVAPLAVAAALALGAACATTPYDPAAERCNPDAAFERGLADGRAGRAMAMLRDLAADFQVVYLTATDRYDHAADLVVELPGPVATDDGAEAADAVPVAAG